MSAWGLTPANKQHLQQPSWCCDCDCDCDCDCVGAGIPVQQLPASKLVCSLVAVLQLTTFAVFIYGMTPLIPDKMPETCVLVACLLALPLLHYR